jgi:hypothetical protein
MNTAPRGGRPRKANEVHDQSLSALVGGAVRNCGAVQMKAHDGTPYSLTLRLPAFVLHPLTAMGIAALHVYLAVGHLSKLFVSRSSGLTFGKVSAH